MSQQDERKKKKKWLYYVRYIKIRTDDYGMKKREKYVKSRRRALK